MRYPKLNLTIEKLRALTEETLNHYYLKDVKFVIDHYTPHQGGQGHFTGQNRHYYFATMKELIDIVANQSQLPEEAFYYPDALATCHKLEEELAKDGYRCSWSDTLIRTPHEPAGPIRAKVCQYHDGNHSHQLAVLRDGTTIKDFSLLT